MLRGSLGDGRTHVKDCEGLSGQFLVNSTPLLDSFERSVLRPLANVLLKTLVLL